ncbi:hypothetical protein Btru_035304 [Bulinus truncatus]|nr:hypothetical protein Btru_035304 [Bulinus truncatus]
MLCRCPRHHITVVAQLDPATRDLPTNIHEEPWIRSVCENSTSDFIDGTNTPVCVYVHQYMSVKNVYVVIAADKHEADVVTAADKHEADVVTAADKHEADVVTAADTPEADVVKEDLKVIETKLNEQANVKREGEGGKGNEDGGRQNRQMRKRRRRVQKTWNRRYRIPTTNGGYLCIPASPRQMVAVFVFLLHRDEWWLSLYSCFTATNGGCLCIPASPRRMVAVFVFLLHRDKWWLSLYSCFTATNGDCLCIPASLRRMVVIFVFLLHRDKWWLSLKFLFHRDQW